MSDNLVNSPKPATVPEMEAAVLSFWQENKIFEKSLERTKARKSFVFYENTEV